LNGVQIAPRSAIGKATSKILDFNATDRLLEREALLRQGRYPSAAAQMLVQSKT